MKPLSRAASFTLVELIAAIAIVAILVAVMVPTVGNFVSQSRQTSDRQTLAVLNDAINRYKMQGGDISALTSGKPFSSLLDTLQAPTTWKSLTQSFWREGDELPTVKTASAAGDGVNFRLTQFNSHDEGGGAPIALVAPPAFPTGPGYLQLANGSAGSYSLGIVTTTGYFAYLNAEGATVISADGYSYNNLAIPPALAGFSQWSYVGSTGPSIMTVAASDRLTIWSCAGAADSTPSGDIYILDCESSSLTSLDVSGLTGLIQLYCGFNSITSLDLTGLSSLATLNCYGNGMTSLNVAGLTSLSSLNCGNNSIASLDLTGCTGITGLYCYSNAITSLDVSALASLTGLYCDNNELTSLTLSASNANIGYLKCYGNTALTGSTAAINGLYASLPDLSGGAVNRLYIGVGAASATDATATAKGWTVNRAD